MLKYLCTPNGVPCIFWKLKMTLNVVYDLLLISPFGTRCSEGPGEIASLRFFLSFASRKANFYCLIWLTQDKVFPFLAEGKSLGLVPLPSWGGSLVHRWHLSLLSFTIQGESFSPCGFAGKWMEPKPNRLLALAQSYPFSAAHTCWKCKGLPFISPCLQHLRTYNPLTECHTWLSGPMYLTRVSDSGTCFCEHSWTQRKKR